MFFVPVRALDATDTTPSRRLIVISYKASQSATARLSMDVTVSGSINVSMALHPEKESAGSSGIAVSDKPPFFSDVQFRNTPSPRLVRFHASSIAAVSRAVHPEKAYRAICRTEDGSDILFNAVHAPYVFSPTVPPEKALSPST